MKEQPPTGDALGFGGLKLQPSLVAAVTALGYEEPTPIQREAIPLLLEGRDLVGQAGTGTGKTAAFILPILDRLARTGATKTRAARALVLVPTRELAMQVAEATHKYARGSRLNVVPLYGGAPMDQQIRALSRGAEFGGKNQQLVHSMTVHIQHLKDVALRFESLSFLGHVTECFHYKTSKGLVLATGLAA